MQPAFRMLIVTLILGSLVALGLWRPGLGDDANRDDVTPETTTGRDKTSAFMRGKLASSQLVLEGLVVGDTDLIVRGADQMRKMGEAAEWQRERDPVYEHYSGEFRRLAGKLATLAEKGNIEGASFTYMHLTTTCISCHEHVRDAVRIADDKEAAAVPSKPGRSRSGMSLQLRR